MDKELIITGLQKAHTAFWNEAKKIPVEYFNSSFNGKWSAAQNVEHINKSIGQFTIYLNVPKEVIAAKFGLANRPSRQVEEANALYTAALSKGLKAPAKFIPDEGTKSLEELTSAGKSALQSMIATLQNWTEEELDKYNCPHPALGNLTVRETFYFTMQHARHHQKAITRIQETVLG